MSYEDHHKTSEWINGNQTTIECIIYCRKKAFCPTKLAECILGLSRFSLSVSFAANIIVAVF